MKNYKVTTTPAYTGGPMEPYYDGSYLVTDRATGQVCGSVAAAYDESWEWTGEWSAMGPDNAWAGTFPLLRDAAAALHKEWELG